MELKSNAWIPAIAPDVDVSDAAVPTAGLAVMLPLEPEDVANFDADWDDVGRVAHISGSDEIVIDTGPSRGLGAELGLASRRRFEAIDLMFEAYLEPSACMIAKVHQVDAFDQTTNSYHVLVAQHRAYLARHGHVFHHFEPPPPGWMQLRIVCQGGVLSFWHNNCLLHCVHDRKLSSGFAFIGAQGGRIRLRGIKLSVAGAKLDRAGNLATHGDDVDELHPVAVEQPRLSIVTTVYDRADCLTRCIASVRRLTFQDYEHLIVADHPPAEALERIHYAVIAANDQRIGLYNLQQRHNNWGIAPAAVGLRRAHGEYLSFLSDDNGYLPDHADVLIRLLNADPTIGFAYSSCQYDGRRLLRYPFPRPGGIDLGQLMFRRELFRRYLDDDLPFNMMAWDWHMVDTFMQRGVLWRHVDQPSFIFRLAKYPDLIPT
jgi:Glycosyl transferase family 2